MDMIMSAIQMLMNFPVIGPIIHNGAAIAQTLIPIVTGIVLFWHALVIIVDGIGSLLKSDSLKALAARMATTEAKIQGEEQSFIMPFLNRLSPLALPVAPSTPVVIQSAPVQGSGPTA